MTMPRHEIRRDDILPMAEYAAIRKDQRRRMTELKRLRRIAVGPYSTFYFESYDTMWHQVHEMLFIEKGGDAQIQDELDAYNPLIPNGNELVATVMFEIDEPARRSAVLFSVGGIENHMLLSIAGHAVRGLPDLTRENTSEDGKASSVQFVRFPLTVEDKKLFAQGGGPVMIGFDHSHYGHLALIPDNIRQTLAQDLAI
jgi:hypothetical protein